MKVMYVKEFADLAIKNGYTDNLCEGWEWIKDNLAQLDYIFQQEDYKSQNGMQYKCLPFLVSEKDNLNDLQKSALHTAWYLNNTREREAREKDYANKMLKEGWLELTEDVIKNAFANKKKIEVNAISQSDWLSTKVERVFKPFIDIKGTCWLMNLKARSKGYYLHQFKHAFCKVI